MLRNISRYYVLGLKLANSPFAFPTIGSTMICDYESYIRIGGMNKKRAAGRFLFYGEAGQDHPHSKKLTQQKSIPQVVVRGVCRLEPGKE